MNCHGQEMHVRQTDIGLAKSTENGVEQYTCTCINYTYFMLNVCLNNCLIIPNSSLSFIYSWERQRYMFLLLYAYTFIDKSLRGMFKHK